VSGQLSLTANGANSARWNGTTPTQQANLTVTATNAGGVSNAVAVTMIGTSTTGQPVITAVTSPQNFSTPGTANITLVTFNASNTTATTTWQIQEVQLEIGLFWMASADTQ